MKVYQKKKKISLNSKVKGTTKKNRPLREIFMTTSVPNQSLQQHLRKGAIKKKLSI
jgi:hypothetical protein